MTSRRIFDINCITASSAHKLYESIESYLKYGLGLQQHFKGSHDKGVDARNTQVIDMIPIDNWVIVLGKFQDMSGGIVIAEGK